MYKINNNKKLRFFSDTLLSNITIQPRHFPDQPEANILDIVTGMKLLKSIDIHYNIYSTGVHKLNQNLLFKYNLHSQI